MGGGSERLGELSRSDPRFHDPRFARVRGRVGIEFKNSRKSAVGQDPQRESSLPRERFRSLSVVGEADDPRNGSSP